MRTRAYGDSPGSGASAMLYTIVTAMGMLAVGLLVWRLLRKQDEDSG